jgi:hypothetical protein
MSWAARREATRAEDLSYSLLGIFRINMPMQYGEGAQAFVRLQKEILRNTNDQSLFAWNLAPGSIEDADRWNLTTSALSVQGMLAASPVAFQECGGVKFLRHHAPSTQIANVNGAFYMEIPVFNRKGPEDTFYVGLLPCLPAHDSTRMMGIMLVDADRGRLRRALVQHGYSTFLASCASAHSAIVKYIGIDTAECVGEPIDFQISPTRQCLIIRSDSESEWLNLTRYPHGAIWHPEDSTLHIGHYNVLNPWNYISLGVESLQNRPRLSINVAFSTSDVIADDMKSRVMLSWENDLREVTGEVSANAPSRAELLCALAKVEAAVESRVIFNQIITELKISVRRYESSDHEEKERAATGTRERLMAWTRNRSPQATSMLEQDGDSVERFMQLSRTKDLKESASISKNMALWVGAGSPTGGLAHFALRRRSTPKNCVYQVGRLFDEIMACAYITILSVQTKLQHAQMVL